MILKYLSLVSVGLFLSIFSLPITYAQQASSVEVRISPSYDQSAESLVPADMVERLSLSPEKVAALEAVFQRRTAMANEILTQQMSSGSFDEEKLKAAMGEAEAEMREELATILSENEMASLQQYAEEQDVKRREALAQDEREEAQKEHEGQGENESSDAGEGMTNAEDHAN